jgi:hypothetical protein
VNIFSAIFWANNMKFVIFVVLSLLVVITGMSGGCDYITGAKPTNSITEEDLIPLLFTDNHVEGRYFLVNPVMYMPQQFFNITEIESEFKKQGYDFSSLLKIFHERNTKEIRMNIPSSQSEGYVIDYEDIMSNYDLPLGWTKLREDYPNLQCIITISVPVYDPRSNIFLVYLGWVGNGLFGSGDIYAFRVINGKLMEIARVGLWIS